MVRYSISAPLHAALAFTRRLGVTHPRRVTNRRDYINPTALPV